MSAGLSISLRKPAKGENGLGDGSFFFVISSAFLINLPIIDYIDPHNIPKVAMSAV
jgi:hypothetical protein